MKKIIILFSSLIVSFSLLFFYSNYKLNAMDSAVTNEQELINAINGNNNVVLSNDITISGAITIPSSYTGTIKSDGTTRTLKLSANFSGENMFVVKTGAKPVFENLTFDGTERGRILDVESNSEVTIANSKLTNASTEQFLKKLENNVNKQRYQGGAIYLSHSTLNLDNVIFESNHTKLETPKAEKEGDPGIAGHGGAIYSATSVINIKGGSFINNYSGITVGGNGTNGEGGAIKLEGGSTLNVNVGVDTKTVFDGNHVYKTNANVGGLQGGALEVTHSVVNINNAEFFVKGGFDTGGAIKFEGAGTKENHNKITNSKFVLIGGQLPQTPVESKYFGTSGGAIMTENSYLTIEKSAFDTDTSKGVPTVAFAGGHIDVVGSGEFNLYDSTLKGNGHGWNSAWLSTAKYGGAIAFENGASAKAYIKNSSFGGYTVDHTGGVISVGHRKGATDELGETTVDLTIEDSTLNGARAYTWNANSAGAGVYISKGSNVVVKGGTINDMQANYGGAIYNMGNLTLDNKATLSNNSATQMAAGIYNDGYLNIHSANLNNNQKTNDAYFAGGNHQFSAGEHSGGTVYAKQNVIVGTDATFSTGAKHDIRVIDGQSSVILSGPRTTQMNVSISEVESQAGAGAYNKGFGENAHRHVGYFVGKGLSSSDLTAQYIPAGMAQSYEPNPEDAKNFHYVSNTVEPEKIAAFNDHEGTGLWDYVYNPENKTVVLGQRAKLVYHTNHESATIENGKADTDPEGQLIEQVYTFYDSGNGKPKVSINNEIATELAKIDKIPNTFTINDKNYRFKDWYNTELKDSPLFDPNTMNLSDGKKFDFGGANTFTNSWHPDANSEISDILNFDSRNTLNTYAVYEPIEKISIKVKKEWDDGNDYSKKRPTSVTVKLKANEKIVDDKILVLNNDTGWEDTFRELEKYKDGEIIKYTVEEVGVDGYTSIISGDVDNGFTITNKINSNTTPGEGGTTPGGEVTPSDKIEINVEKIWNDNNNLNNKRPTSVTIVLTENGVDTDKTLELNNVNRWKGKFVALEKIKSGAEVKYDIREISVDGYESSKTGDATNGFIVTNKLKDENNSNGNQDDNKNIKGSIEVEKKWSSSKEQFVEVQLYKNGVKFGNPIKLNDDNNWKYKFDDLFVKENGNDVVYSIKEVGETGGYVAIGSRKYNVVISENSVQSDQSKKAFVITNTLISNNPPSGNSGIPSSNDKPSSNSDKPSGNDSVVNSNNGTSTNSNSNESTNSENNSSSNISNTTSQSSLPKTGDGYNYALLSVIMMIISAVLILGHRKTN